MALIRDIRHNLENSKVLNKNSQTNNRNQTKEADKNDNESGNKKRAHSEITTDRKEKTVELKGISKEILDERKKANMCLKCGKGSHKWYECFAKEPITTKTVPKVKGVLQVKDTRKEEKKDVMISGVGMEDERGGRIIELVTDSDGEYDLLR